MRNRAFLYVAVVALLVAGLFTYRTMIRTPVCETHTFEGSAFSVCIFRPGRQEVALVWAEGQGRALGGFEALEASWLVDNRRVVFAMNAGMFDASGAPIGLFVAKGQEEHALNQQAGSGNFYMQPNGVFFVDEKRQPRVLTTADYASSGVTPVWATQSGPMLVTGGAINAQFGQDGDSRYVRNGVGVHDGLGFFVISEEPVSFGKFARFFRDALKCEDALYLDGAVSSLWVPSSGRRDAGYRLGPMVVVSDRPRNQS
ncbi:MAG: hypothetical protein HOP13_14605 [Alphaproteobacteria bacterium]|nr:hypothetical protein [Alphaproteobacteria bacterium]